MVDKIHREIKARRQSTISRWSILETVLGASASLAASFFDCRHNLQRSGMKEKITNALKVIVPVVIILIAWFGTAIQGIRLFEREYSLAELVLNGVLLFVIIGPIVIIALGVPYITYKLIRWKLKR
jgi:hypothetical protein